MKDKEPINHQRGYQPRNNGTNKLPKPPTTGSDAYKPKDSEKNFQNIKITT